jgi:hypothetical protein
MRNIAVDTALNAYATALGHIVQLEQGLAEAVQTMQGLKDGSISIERLVATDDGWELMPDAPAG